MNRSKSPSKQPPGLLNRLFTGWIPLIAYTAFIFQGAILPPSEIPRFLIHFNDKLIHGAEYFLLFFLVANVAIKAPQPEFRRHGVLTGLAYCAFTGFLTELVQKMVPGRSCEFWDWMGDMAGAALGAFIMMIAVHFKKERVL